MHICGRANKNGNIVDLIIVGWWPESQKMCELKYRTEVHLLDEWSDRVEPFIPEQFATYAILNSCLGLCYVMAIKSTLFSGPCIG